MKIAIICCRHNSDLIYRMRDDRNKDVTTRIFTKNYAINETKQSYAGEVIVDVSNYYQSIIDLGEMESLKNFKVRQTYFTTNEKFTITGTMELDSKNYRVLYVRGYSPFLLVGEDNFLLNKIYDPVWWTYPFDVTIEPLSVEFKKITRTTYASDVPNPRYQLIYNGANDVSFFLNYREFTLDNITRPAFYQDLTYAKKQKTIRFKNLAIEVERVDNEKIIYKILQD